MTAIPSNNFYSVNNDPRSQVYKPNKSVIDLDQITKDNTAKTDTLQISTQGLAAQQGNSTTASSKPITYTTDQLNKIQALKDNTNQESTQLKQMVLDLLKKQGYSDSQISNKQLDEVKVDKDTQAQAQQLISPGGDLSAENVSDKIVEFAKAISGGDKSKLKELKAAIDEGFSQAKQALGGGDMPDITNQTYKLIQDKLDAWEKDTGDTAASVNSTAK